MKNNTKILNKKNYVKPTLKKFGSVKKLTLKAGSQSDVFGDTYTP